MPFNRLFILLSALISSFISFSQEDSTANPATIPVVELELMLGGGFSVNPLVSENFWDQYTTNFQEPSADSGYTKNGTFTSGAPAIVFSFRKSYHNRGLEKSRIRSSFGMTIGFAPGVWMQENWERTTTVTIDSFTMTQTGVVYANDSTSYESFFRTFQTNQAVIGLSQRFQTNPGRRWTFHFGADLLYGFSVNKSLWTSQVNNWSTTVPLNSLQSNHTVVSEQYTRSPNVHTVEVQFPFEIAVKPWFKRESMKKITVGTTIRPGIRWYALGDQQGVVSTFWMGIVYRYLL